MMYILYLYNINIQYMPRRKKRVEIDENESWDKASATTVTPKTDHVHSILDIIDFDPGTITEDVNIEDVDIDHIIKVIKLRAVDFPAPGVGFGIKKLEEILNGKRPARDEARFATRNELLTGIDPSDINENIKISDTKNRTLFKVMLLRVLKTRNFVLGYEIKRFAKICEGNRLRATIQRRSRQERPRHGRPRRSRGRGRGRGRGRRNDRRLRERYEERPKAKPANDEEVDTDSDSSE